MAKKLLILVGATVIGAAFPMYAALITATSGVTSVSAPGSVVQNVSAAETPNGPIIFREQTRVLTAALWADILAGPAAGTTYTIAGPALPSGNIPVGTNVSSFYLHMDPPNQPTTSPGYTGSITFDAPILGIMVYDIYIAASSILQVSGTNYNTVANVNYGLNPGVQGDSLTISPDRKTFSFTLNPTTDADDLRIIVDPVSIPEPATALLVLPALAGLALLRRRAAR
jgi:hypothetical protein